MPFLLKLLQGENLPIRTLDSSIYSHGAVNDKKKSQYFAVTKLPWQRSN